MGTRPKRQTSDCMRIVIACSCSKYLFIFFYDVRYLMYDKIVVILFGCCIKDVETVCFVFSPHPIELLGVFFCQLPCELTE